MIDATDAKTPGLKSDSTKMRIDAHDITPDQLQRLGVSQVAYVKQVVLNGTMMFAIHGADGSPMALAEDRNLALAAIVQHEMIPALVH